MALQQVSSAIGSLPPTHVMERLSAAYINAVAASAGCSCSAPEGGQDYGTDFDLEPVSDTRSGSVVIRPGIKLQAKATITATIEDDCIKYIIKGKAFNKIVLANSNRRPTALVLYRMPQDQNLWLTRSDDHLRLSHSAYWDFLSGDQINPETTKVIRIPLSQYLSKDTIPGMFDIADRIMFGNRHE